MVRYGFTSMLLLISVTQVTCQFFDFFAALQPLIQNPSRPNHQYDITTKRPRKTTIKNTRRTNAISYNTDENYSGKRLTTLAPSFETDYNSNRRPQKPRKDSGENAVKKRPNTELHLNTDRNPYLNELNHKYTTQNPFPNRPGVKPAVVNGPPITNKPPTVAPFEDSPEIILGPDEDFMSSTDKRRHVEFAERMCDKYKSMSMKQVQAIPLVPSPRPLRVNVSSCVPSKVPLVVGGKVVNIKEFPHMVLLGWRKIHSNGYSWKCGGSLLSDRYVLTAAHCAYQDKDNSVMTGPPRAAQLGSSFLDDPGALVVKVASVIRHPKYKLPKSYYDIALIKLAKAVSFSDVIKPACLGTPPSPGEPIIATGWGRTEFGGDQSVELRSVSIPVWDMSQCRDILGTSRKIPDGPSSSTQICAGEVNGGKDTCQGDSGGPAQIQDGCVWRVVAVTSLGRSCGAPRTPALYAIAHPVFISAVVFGEQSNKQSNKNKNDYDTYNSEGNYNQNTRRDNNYESNSRRSVGASRNTGNNRNDQQASGNSYNQNYGSNENSQRPYNEENHSTSHNYGNDRNNNYNHNYESNNKQYGNNQNSRRVSDSVINHSENNDQGVSGNSYNINYATNNQNSRNDRFETTTSSEIRNGVKYIRYDNDNYHTNIKNNQQNYYQTDRNTNYNQQSSHQNYPQNYNNHKSSNSDYQNDDPDNYSRNNQENNSQIFYQNDRKNQYTTADNKQYDIRKPYESDRRQSDRVWWT